MLTAGGIIALHVGEVGRDREPLAEPFDAILELGGEPMRDRRWPPSRRGCVRSPRVEQHSLATIAAGGKRLRPLLVLRGRRSAAARTMRALSRGGRGRADPLGDPRARRRARRRAAAPRPPDRVPAAGRRAATATGDLLFSSAFAELADNGDVAQWRALDGRLAALPAGELMQRADAWRADVTVERYLQRCS